MDPLLQTYIGVMCSIAVLVTVITFIVWDQGTDLPDNIFAPRNWILAILLTSLWPLLLPLYLISALILNRWNIFKK